MKKSKKTPSRIRYEKAHPTVSSRLTVETKEKLLRSLKTLGMSLADAFKVLAGDLEVKAIPIEEARKAGVEEGKNRYMISYSCRLCGKPIIIASEKEKEAASEYMTERGWSHSECQKKRNLPQ